MSTRRGVAPEQPLAYPSAVIGSRGHPVFAAFWDWHAAHESPRQQRARRWVMAGTCGRILEIGAGVGANWAFLPPGAAYAGIEPDPHMLARARKHMRERGLELDLYEAVAEDLPFPSASFDTVISTLTLCTVTHLDRALAEVRRVLRPGGQLRYWEHTRPAGRVGGVVFDAITPAWRKVGAGCHPNRRTEEAIARGGFVIQQSDRVNATVPMRAGVAIVPGGGGAQPCE